MESQIKELFLRTAQKIWNNPPGGPNYTQNFEADNYCNPLNRQNAPEFEKFVLVVMEKNLRKIKIMELKLADV